MKVNLRRAVPPPTRAAGTRADAGEMLRSCEILQRGAHTEGGAVFLPPGVDARQCWGFMSAVQQFTIDIGEVTEDRVRELVKTRRKKSVD